MNGQHFLLETLFHEPMDVAGVVGRLSSAFSQQLAFEDSALLGRIMRGMQAIGQAAIVVVLAKSGME